MQWKGASRTPNGVASRLEICSEFRLQAVFHPLLPRQRGTPNGVASRLEIRSEFRLQAVFGAPPAPRERGTPKRGCVPHGQAAGKPL